MITKLLNFKAKKRSELADIAAASVGETTRTDSAPAAKATSTVAAAELRK